MKVETGNSLLIPSFGQSGTNVNMKNEALNFGVVAPPDKLPNGSLNGYAKPQQPTANSTQTSRRGKTSLTAGQISAGLSFGVMLMSAVTLLAGIKKGFKGKK